MPAFTGDLKAFCVALPKVELHAHINGSISFDTIKKLTERKKAEKPYLADYQIPENSLDGINDFFPLFKLIYQLTDDIEAIKIVTRDVIDEFAKDGTRYLELRSTPRKYDDTDLKTKDLYVQTVLSVINQPRDDIVVKLILSVDRRNTLEEAMETVELAIKYKNQGVVAVDLCGDVHAGTFETVKPAFLKAQQHGLKVTLHFCEVPENLPEAPSLLAISPDRLGHATLLDEACRSQIYQERIPIEVCMTSNVLSKTVPKYEDHHVKDLLLAGQPFVICTDDKGVFRADLSDEYMRAATAFTMTNQQLYEASFASIDAIFAGDATKESIRKEWNQWYERNVHYFDKV
ncbi:hypothetical protein K450DRAFT_228241 [Umbelopsis ramanniana AG]|uniref:Adenosine deaminase domain-containing protein n=1 Tax=Umbelopsis ramanniana AG TaxID=1314678 RepID=A0AAD5HH55_UMBRA|nr:uncharacterized protein K450DRAFT_228241 [Umbelopsis ramanniana AG]KAI8582286.1 hypothetical protein K450DRAFT_228241 [Umbelopsis ramanniana AG]